MIRMMCGKLRGGSNDVYMYMRHELRLSYMKNA